MTKFVCTGKDGVSRVFEYVLERHPLSSQWQYRVWTDSACHTGEFFDLTLADLEEGVLRVVWMGHHGAEEYQAKGIPDAILEIASTQLEQVVQSSPEHGNTGDVRRSPDATKVWKRLIVRGVAIYDARTDVYRIPVGSAKKNCM